MDYDYDLTLKLGFHLPSVCLKAKVEWVAGCRRRKAACNIILALKRQQPGSKFKTFEVRWCKGRNSLFSISYTCE